MPLNYYIRNVSAFASKVIIFKSKHFIVSCLKHWRIILQDIREANIYTGRTLNSSKALISLYEGRHSCLDSCQSDRWDLVKGLKDIKTLISLYWQYGQGGRQTKTCSGLVLAPDKAQALHDSLVHTCLDKTPLTNLLPLIILHSDLICWKISQQQLTE